MLRSGSRVKFAAYSVCPICYGKGFLAGKDARAVDAALERPETHNKERLNQR